MDAALFGKAMRKSDSINFWQNPFLRGRDLFFMQETEGLRNWLNFGNWLRGHNIHLWWFKSDFFPLKLELPIYVISRKTIINSQRTVKVRLFWLLLRLSRIMITVHTRSLASKCSLDFCSLGSHHLYCIQEAVCGRFPTSSPGLLITATIQYFRNASVPLTNVFFLALVKGVFFQTF